MSLKIHHVLGLRPDVSQTLHQDSWDHGVMPPGSRAGGVNVGASQVLS